MSWTDAEKKRIEAIESMMNKIQTAVGLLASQTQLRSLSALRQKEINDLTSRIVALESQVSILQKNSI